MMHNKALVRTQRAAPHSAWLWEKQIMNICSAMLTDTPITNSLSGLETAVRAIDVRCSGLRMSPVKLNYPEAVPQKYVKRKMGI